MILETPYMQEMIAERIRETRVETILRVLQVRFDSVSSSVTARLEQVGNGESLDCLTDQAALCSSLQAFADSLLQELAASPASKRDRKRRRKVRVW